MGAERDDRLSLFSVWELETGSGVGQDAWVEGICVGWAHWAGVGEGKDDDVEEALFEQSKL